MYKKGARPLLLRLHSLCSVNLSLPKIMISLQERLPAERVISPPNEIKSHAVILFDMNRTKNHI